MGPWLIRMARWARNPPSARRVRLVLAVVAICLALVAVERLGFWPESFGVNRMHR